MNPIVKGWWVGALGSYSQGHGYLHRVETNTGRHAFCPSGILVDLYQRSVNQPLPVIYKPMSKILSVAVYGDEGDMTAMPEVVAEWAGIDRYPKVVLPNGKEWFISVINDAGYGFDYIASVIERYL